MVSNLKLENIAQSDENFKKFLTYNKKDLSVYCVCARFGSIRCHSRMHKCSCNISRNLCKGIQHKCICSKGCHVNYKQTSRKITNINICKANTHVCICKIYPDDECLVHRE